MDLSSDLKRTLLAISGAAVIACGGGQTQTTGAPPCPDSEKFQKAEREPFGVMTAAELNDALQARPETFVFDVNRLARYAKSHVPGAAHLDKEQVTAERLPVNKAARVVFYCAGPT
jgi:hypothetical protein